MQNQMNFITSKLTCVAFSCTVGLVSCTQPDDVRNLPISKQTNARRSKQPGESLVLWPSANPLVTNGAAYDAASVAISSAVHEISVPNAFIVRTEGNAKELKIFMLKELEYMGHPPARISITKVREDLGVATKTEGYKMSLIKYGGGMETMEGGVGFSVVVIAPLGTYITRRADEVDTSWENRIVEGWHPVPYRPDPERMINNFLPKTAQPE